MDEQVTTLGMLKDTLEEKIKDQARGFEYPYEYCAVGLKTLGYTNEVLYLEFLIHGLTEKGRADLGKLFVVVFGCNLDNLGVTLEELLAEIRNYLEILLDQGIRVEDNLMLVSWDTPNLRKKKEVLGEFEYQLKQQLLLYKKEFLGLCIERGVPSGSVATVEYQRMINLGDVVLNSVGYIGVAVSASLGRLNAGKVVYSKTRQRATEMYVEDFEEVSKRLFAQEFQSGKRDFLGTYSILWGEQGLFLASEQPYMWLTRKPKSSKISFDKIEERLSQWKQGLDKDKYVVDSLGNGITMVTLGDKKVLISSLGVSGLRGEVLYKKTLDDDTNLVLGFSNVKKYTGDMVFALGLLAVYDLRRKLE